LVYLLTMRPCRAPAEPLPSPCLPRSIEFTSQFSSTIRQFKEPCNFSHLTYHPTDNTRRYSTDYRIDALVVLIQSRTKWILEHASTWFRFTSSLILILLHLWSLALACIEPSFHFLRWRFCPILAQRAFLVLILHFLPPLPSMVFPSPSEIPY